MARKTEERADSKRREKSQAAFRTISEAAAILDIPMHVLRFWETKFPSIQPTKRGGGRRYYRPEDLALLQRVRDLLYNEGYTIKGAQKLLRHKASLPPKPPAANGLLAPVHDQIRQGELKAILAELVELRDILRKTS